MKAVPLTHFYPSDKRERNTTPEDASVTAIINGMDHLKSPTKRPSLLPGKRQREEEPALKGLSETEIQQVLAESEPLTTSDEPTKPSENVPTDSDKDASTSSPKSPKRQKRLIDFYSLEDTG